MFSDHKELNYVKLRCVLDVRKNLVGFFIFDNLIRFFLAIGS